MLRTIFAALVYSVGAIALTMLGAFIVDTLLVRVLL